ncbi:MAG: hypothetical protein R2939_19805 [Kofleriaceae bacterium]
MSTGKLEESSFHLGGGAEDKARISDADGRFVIADAPRGEVTITGFSMDFANSAYGFVQIPVDVDGPNVDLGDLPVARMRAPAMERGGDFGVAFKDAAPGTRAADRVLEVSRLRPGGPGEGSPAVGDVIVSIDGHDVRGRNGYLAATLMHVPVGTAVEFGLARGATVSITAAAPP